MNRYSSPAHKAPLSPDEFPVDERTFSLVGDTLVLTAKGELILLEEIAGEYDSKVELLGIDAYGRMTVTTAYDFVLEDWTNRIANVTASNGLKVRGKFETQVLTPSNSWTDLSSLEFGSVIKTAIYDPSKPVPEWSVDEIVHARIEQAEEPEPLFNFKTTKSQGFFIANKVEEKIMLIVIRCNNRENS